MDHSKSALLPAGLSPFMDVTGAVGAGVNGAAIFFSSPFKMEAY